MAPELLGLLVGAIFWIFLLSFFVGWLLATARARFRASLHDDGNQGADWGAEGIHNDAGAA